MISVTSLPYSGWQANEDTPLMIRAAPFMLPGMQILPLRHELTVKI